MLYKWKRLLRRFNASGDRALILSTSRLDRFITQVPTPDPSSFKIRDSQRMRRLSGRDNSALRKPQGHASTRRTESSGWPGRAQLRQPWSRCSGFRNVQQENTGKQRLKIEHGERPVVLDHHITSIHLLQAVGPKLRVQSDQSALREYAPQDKRLRRVRAPVSALGV